MSHYGQLFADEDEIRDEERDHSYIYKYFDDYFNHPDMVKIKNINSHSMYMCKTYCLLSNECRYIIVFVAVDDNKINVSLPLIELKWISIQTRTLSTKYDIPSHGYQPKRGGPLQVPINRVKFDNDTSYYSCTSLPIVITLLHNDKGEHEYQASGNVISAIETYNTIIVFEDK